MLPIPNFFPPPPVTAGLQMHQFGGVWVCLKSSMPRTEIGVGERQRLHYLQTVRTRCFWPENWVLKNWIHQIVRINSKLSSATIYFNILFCARMFRRSLRIAAVERPTNWSINWCKFLITHAENNRQGVAYRMV
jgi:hypothetical protein